MWETFSHTIPNASLVAASCHDAMPVLTDPCCALLLDFEWHCLSRSGFRSISRPFSQAARATIEGVTRPKLLNSSKRSNRCLTGTRSYRARACLPRSVGCARFQEREGRHRSRAPGPQRKRGSKLSQLHNHGQRCTAERPELREVCHDVSGDGRLTQVGECEAGACRAVEIGLEEMNVRKD